MSLIIHSYCYVGAIFEDAAASLSILFAFLVEFSLEFDYQTPENPSLSYLTNVN